MEKVSSDLRAQTELFEKNVTGVMASLNENLARMKAEADGGVSDGLLARAAEMQMTMADIRRSVESLAAGAAAAGGKEA